MEDFSRRPVVILPPGDEDLLERARVYDLEAPVARLRFREFFKHYKQGNIYIYREALLRQWNRREYFVEVDLQHIHEFDVDLFQNLQSNPSDFLTYCESAVKDAIVSFLTSQGAQEFESIAPEFQVVLSSAQNPQSLRDLTSEHINHLIKVPGIIIKCSEIRSKATIVTCRCTKCGDIKRITSKSPMSSIAIPLKCDRGGQPGEDCGVGTYTIMTDDCKYIDQQKLKLQESPEIVPTGEMPRNILLIVERYLIDRVSPGTRVSVLGILSLVGNSASRQHIKAGNAVKTPFLRVVGIHIETEGGGRVSTIFTPQEEEQFQRMSRDPEIYDKIARSIAPQLSGEYTIDIKKALACLLVGGSRKTLPDNVRLRGDINVLLMGDPSTAKSQFLKFVERVAPIGVYTSGKGSSAAGLTAAVTKDAKGEFYLEGGAMVLADGGVICIDEFDKMRETDRVAIHEAMEQQTISIAKAGITTVLNSRASVLAAANPIFGRYDALKSVGENIDLMTTILSRFDCIFLVRDVRDMERDKNIARHVLGVHVRSALSDNTQQNNKPEIDADTLKKYIAYCRDRCAPRLSEAASNQLSGQFVHIRNRVRESLKNRPGESQVVPITVRQLEALIRISESLAKMRLSAEASVVDVEEAIRLFRVSTLTASEANPALMGVTSGGGSDDIKKAEDYLRRRIGVKMTINAQKIIEESMVQGYSNEVMKRAIAAMIMRQELQELNQRKLLRRIR